MLVLKNNNRAVHRNLYNDFLRGDIYDRLDRNYKSTPRSNIIDNKENYEVQIIAAGYIKNNFILNVENDHLIIKASVEASDNQQANNYVHNEFEIKGFEKSFKLSKNVDSTKIEATYENGILKIIIPKKEEAYIKRTVEVK